MIKKFKRSLSDLASETTRYLKFLPQNFWWRPKMDLPDLFSQYSRTVVPINVEKPNGDLDCGTGFHIGDGYIVTARHVVEGMKSVVVKNESITISNILFHKNPQVDLAVLQTDFNLSHWMRKVTVVGKENIPKVDRIQLGGHLDDWLGDQFMLSSALIVGYPRIPRSKYQVQVAAYAQVGATMDEYTSKHPYFILNTTARGGYSGAPVISEWGFLLGVITDCFYEGEQQYETGFMAALSIEPLLVMLQENNIVIENNENILYSIWV